MSARKLVLAALAVCLAVPLLAGPILTTIEDVIYNADGTPYNGIAVIKWTPFVAGDTSQIFTQPATTSSPRPGQFRRAPRHCACKPCSRRRVRLHRRWSLEALPYRNRV